MRKPSRKTLRKKSLNTLPKLKRKAWKLFSKYICKRDDYICFTCGKAGNQAGHFRHGRLDFDEMNVNCQCARCNKWLHGRLDEYAIRLKAKYGEKKFDALVSRSNQFNDYTREDLEKIIKKYAQIKESH